MKKLRRKKTFIADRSYANGVVPVWWSVMQSLTVSRPEAVIFDFDGVIVDTEPLHYRSFQEVLEPLGIGFTWPEYVKTYMGFDDRDAFLEAFRVRGRELDEQGLQALVAAKSNIFQDVIRQSNIFQDVIRQGVTAYPGVVRNLTSLHASGLPLAICSGALRSDITPILAQLGVVHCFRHIITADDVRKSKPDPECYSLAFHRLLHAHPSRISSPGKCLAIEDTPAGIRAAKLAGLNVLAVTNSYSEKELTEADYLTDSLENVRIS
jgi:beta-phosphoglucomutase